VTRRSQSQRLQEILATFDHRDPVSLSEWQMPIRVQYRESSFFGDRAGLRLFRWHQRPSIHNGHDFAVPRGTSVFAPSPVGSSLAEEWIVTGNYGDPGLCPRGVSAFLPSGPVRVTQGQWVRAGDRLGTVGSTGLSTGPHLHWEVRINGVAVQGDEILGSPLLDKRPFITIMEGHFEKGGDVTSPRLS
jgi:murein DD-endopeptidase MepM/ murein hydrolase activator NlpD